MVMGLLDLVGYLDGCLLDYLGGHLLGVPLAHLLSHLLYYLLHYLVGNLLGLSGVWIGKNNLWLCVNLTSKRKSPKTAVPIHIMTVKFFAQKAYLTMRNNQILFK
jgi:hypothetical protein